MLPLSRSWSAILPTAALIIGFAGSTPELLADASHSHTSTATEHAHAAGASSADISKLNSPGEAWAVIQSSVSQIQELAAAKDLKAIHVLEENVAAALKYLQANSPMVTGDKQKRLASALNQTLTFSGNVHTASDAGDQAKTEAELKKLQAALKLVAAQYPAETLQAPPGFVKYQCPMNDFTGDKPGDCPTCGMKLKPLIAAGGEHQHGEHADGHRHGAAAATMTLAATSAQPLTIGQKVDVTIVLKKKDGTPVLLDELKEAHTRKLHLLIIDPSLTDYHHEHPVPTGKPGEYAFSFTPKKPGSYRIWADVISSATGEQEYVITDLAASTKAEPVGPRPERLNSTVDGLRYTLAFKEPLKAGDASLGTLTVKDAKGEVIPSLEPVMGAYAHIVGFSQDFKTIAHIHPMGEEPTKPTDRGRGELQFHLLPEQPGLLMLFAQVQIEGKNKFVPFTLTIHPSEGGHAEGAAAP